MLTADIHQHLLKKLPSVSVCGGLTAWCQLKVYHCQRMFDVDNMIGLHVLANSVFDLMVLTLRPSHFHKGTRPSMS